MDDSVPRQRIPTLLLALLLSGISAIPGERISAQEVEGPIAPAGQLRIGVAPSIWSSDSRYGSRRVDGSLVEEVEPLGFDLSHDRLPASLFPGLSALESELRAAADDPALSLGLGRARAEVSQTSIRVPIQVDLGVTEWLTVGVTVPLVGRRSEVGLLFSADSLNADLGPSPAQIAPMETTEFLDAVAAANSALQAEVDASCGADPGSAACQGAQAALSQGEGYVASVSAAYDSGLFPFTGSDAADLLQSRLDALQALYASYGVDAMPAGSELPLSPGPLSQTDFQVLLTQPAAGIAANPLGTWFSAWEVGDVELHGSLRVLEWSGDGDGSSAAAPTFTQPRLMVGLGGLVRLGTGAPDDPDTFYDLGSGDGQMDMELRAFTDLQFGGDLGLWADVRRGIQLEGERVRRVAPPEVVLAPLASRTRVSWEPGDYWIVEAAPRWGVTPELAVAGRYRLWTKGRDRYALIDAGAGDASLDADDLERETEETRHEAGISLVYSTLAVADATGTRPMEVRFRYLRSVAGSGGLTPKGSRFEASLRLFWSLWGD